MEEALERASLAEQCSETTNIEVALVDKELMHIVFGFLHFTDVASISTVCRRWRALADDDEVRRVLMHGRVLSMGVTTHTGLGYRPTEGPKRWRMIRDLEHNVLQLATTAEVYDKQHTIVVTEDGPFGTMVYGFGDATDEKLGFPTPPEITDGKCVPIPQPVPALLGQRVIKVGVGGAHSMALTERGTVFSWGFKGNARLGDGDTGSGSRGTPQELRQIGANHSVQPFIVDLWCGKGLTLLLDQQGVLYSFGVDSGGSLGRTVVQGQHEPMPVEFPEGVKIKSAACGYNHNLALTTDGVVYSWGIATYGRLGHGNEETVTPPQPIAALAGVKAVQVACGSSHSLVLAQDGTLYAFGQNQDGELGIPDVTNQFLPRVVEALLGESPIVAISAAARQSVVLLQDGRVVAFGEGSYAAREIKRKNWLMPRSVVAGDGGVFMVC